MTDDEVRRIRVSFAALHGKTDELGRTFYGRLFSTHPQLRPMFPQDMSGQPKKLVQMLALVVGNLHAFHTVARAVEDLALRHVGYGVQTEHYAVVEDTLLWSLERTVGPAFCEEDRRAWTTAFAALSEVMTAASARFAAPEPGV